MARKDWVTFFVPAYAGHVYREPMVFRTREEAYQWGRRDMRYLLVGILRVKGRTGWDQQFLHDRVRASAHMKRRVDRA